MAVEAGAWYRVSLGVNTATGVFGIRVLDGEGLTLLERDVAMPNYDPARGQYNRVAVFDGEYASGAVTPGQFTVDNVAYVPAPGGAGLVLGAAALGTRRRRDQASAQKAASRAARARIGRPMMDVGSPS